MDNQLQQVKSIQESTAVIKSNEELVGLGLWNIGKELKYIRDNKTYKQLGLSSFQEYTEKELDYSRRKAYNFIRVAEKYDVHSGAQIGNMGIKKLLELAKIEDEEERQEFIEQKHEIDGEEKTIDDMTTRELKKIIKEKDELRDNIPQWQVDAIKHLQRETWLREGRA